MAIIFLALYPNFPDGAQTMRDGNRGLVERIFKDAQFIRSLGIELTSFGEGWCETKVKASPTLICRAQVLRAGKNLIFVEAEVIAEQDRITIAKASSTLAVIPRS